MSGIYIPRLAMPTEETETIIRIQADGTVLDQYGHHLAITAIPVPDHGWVLKVLKTERECVSRDCDRDCVKCDLSMERSEILSAYDALIAVLAAPTIIPASAAEEGE